MPLKHFAQIVFVSDRGMQNTQVDALVCERNQNLAQLILIDVMMPFMSGLDLLKQLRADRRFAKVPVVLMNNTELTVKQDEHQWEGFLRKPFDCSSPIKTVTRFIQEG
jgi:CheY-like chemotaxis protein